MILDALSRSTQLTLENFNNWPANNPFTSTHRDALIHLIENEQVNPQEAVNRIRVLNENQARELLPPRSPGPRIDEVD